MATVGPVTNDPDLSVDPAALPRRRPRPMRLLSAVIAVLVVMAVGVGCGGGGDSISSDDGDTTEATDATGNGSGEGDGGGEAGCVQVENDAIEIVTTSFDYDPECITTSGDRLQVTYDNQEEGVQHNIHFKDVKSSTGEARTELKSGPDVQTLTLVDLEPGTYAFICDIHSSMTGELVVE